MLPLRTLKCVTRKGRCDAEKMRLPVLAPEASAPRPGAQNAYDRGPGFWPPLRMA